VGGELKLHHMFLDTTVFIEELLKMQMLKKLIISNIIKISLLGSARLTTIRNTVTYKYLNFKT
jgi:hypothetical protein